MKLTFLGTGTSHGIPMINCNCDVCTSDDPKDKRLRTSVLIQDSQTTILIDTSIDLRQQLLQNPQKKIDAVLFTHTHADHVFGFDDLRVFNRIQNSAIPVYGNRQTIKFLTEKFSYAFNTSSGYRGHPQFTPNIIQDDVMVNTMYVRKLDFMHGQEKIAGYRIGNLAYCTDVSHIPENTYKDLQDLDVLILDLLREKPHPTHFHFKKAIREAQKIASKKTYFTHMNHKISHAHHSKRIPANMFFAYDGLIVEST